jgi:hypothetical protein
MAYVDYRSPDYTKASAGPITGTCIEAVSSDQLAAAWYDTDSWSCSDGSKEELQDLLSASVHAMYDQHTNAAAYTGTSKEVYDAVISAAQGTDSGYKITRQAAYDALAAIGTPSTVDCDALYSLSSEGAAPNPVSPAVVCDADVPVSNAAPSGVTPDTAMLYTHCVVQFSYARSYPKRGTFGIPLVGNTVEPVLLPLVGVNSTTPWEQRARVIVGTRWGYSTVFYVIAMLAVGFHIMDGSILLLAELTRVSARRRPTRCPHTV